jgi:hypothetical protein
MIEGISFCLWASLFRLAMDLAPTETLGASGASSGGSCEHHRKTWESHDAHMAMSQNHPKPMETLVFSHQNHQYIWN